MRISTAANEGNKSSVERVAPHSAITAAKAWKTRLPQELRSPSNARGVALFSISAVAYIVTFWAMCSAPRIIGVIGYGTLNVVAIGAMFVAGHDAAHRTLVRSGWLNRVLGRIAFLPAWHPFTSWVYAHNTLHHGWTGFKGKHPDFCPLSKLEYDSLPGWRRALEHTYRSPLGVGLCYIVDFYGKYLLWPNAARRSPNFWAGQWDRLLVLVFMGLQFGVGTLLVARSGRDILPHAMGSVVIISLAWAAWAYMMGIASYQHHTHPRTAWYENVDEWNFYHVQLRSSTHMAMPAFVDRLVHNIMDHPAHHLDPTIPMYQLPQSQRLLEEYAGEHAVVVPWSIGEFIRTCRVCKLYDFKEHCWIDFDGRPTSTSGLSGLPSMSKPA